MKKQLDPKEKQMVKKLIYYIEDNEIDRRLKVNEVLDQMFAGYKTKNRKIKEYENHFNINSACWYFINKYRMKYKRVSNQINKAEKFNSKCLAEVFKMMKSGKGEYVRGYILVEVHKRKGIEFYTVWRECENHEEYDVEVKSTFDVNKIAKYLTMVCNYEFADWNCTYEDLKDIRDNASNYYNYIEAEPYVM
jgi:hypothetical protein